MNSKNKIFYLLLLFLFFTSYLSYILVKENGFSIISKIVVDDLSLDTINYVSPKIFCIILTSKNNLKTKAKIIYNTWATKCDNFKFISLIPDELKTNNTNISNKYLSELDELFYKNWLQPPGLLNDTYEKLTDKMYISFKYIRNNYSDYDWYLKADDDTFIFVDNLKRFLSDKNSSKPVTFGYDFKVIVNNGYHSGGGGYVLSNEALKRIGSKLNEDYSFCPNTGTEDVDVAKCLRKLEVYPNKSIDNLGRERFHPLNINGHYYGEFPDWMFSYASNPVQKGLNCCSDTSISFHYMSSEEIIKANNIYESQKNSSRFSFKNFLDKYLN